MFVFVVFPAALSEAQGTFQNLGFESALLVPIPGDPYGRVQFTPAFPGWTGYVGSSSLQSAALYNSVFLDSSGISIIDQSWQHYLGSSPGVIEGSYIAILQAGFPLGAFTPADTTISQSGLVPTTAQSLRFSANFVTLASAQTALRVVLGGQQLTFLPLSSGTNYTVFGADIQAWGGQTAELNFIAIAENPHQNNRYVFLDDIQFSDMAVPEPNVLELLGLGVGVGIIFSKKLKR